MAVERTYTIPLRREWLKSPRYRRAKKAVTAVKQFLTKHMKSEDIRLGKHLNEELWKHGIKNPPCKIKINVIKDDKDVVRAELFGKKIELEKKEEKKGIAGKLKEKITGKKEEKPKKAKKKEEVKEEKPAEKKEAAKPEEKKEEVKKEEPKVKEKPAEKKEVKEEKPAEKKKETPKPEEKKEAKEEKPAEKKEEVKKEPRSEEKPKAVPKEEAKAEPKPAQK